MSQFAYDELQKVRQRLLESQRKCAWCNQVFDSADSLVNHILEKHPKSVGHVTE